MDCQKFRENIEAIAIMSPDEFEPGVVAHLLECAECRNQLHQAQEAWLTLPAALPEASSDMTQLEAKVMRQLETRTSLPSSDSKLDVWRYAVAATVLFALLGATILAPRWMGLELFPSRSTDLKRVRSIAESMQKLDELERVFAAPQTKYVTLRSAGPSGYLIQDPESQQAHFFGNGFQISAQSKLVIWLLDADRKVIDAATIEVQGTGTNAGLGSALLSLPSNREVATVMVTKESLTAADSQREPSKRVVLESDL